MEGDNAQRNSEGDKASTASNRGADKERCCWWSVEISFGTYNCSNTEIGSERHQVSFRVEEGIG